MVTFVSIKTALLIHTLTSAPYFISFCTVIGVYLYFRSWRRETLLWCMTLVATAGIVLALKALFAIPRPTSAYIELTGYGFPSTHAGLAMSVALFFFLTSSRIFAPVSDSLRNWQISAFVLAVMIGFSRISLGVHTPFQVFAGFGVGLIVTSVVFFFLYKK